MKICSFGCVALTFHDYIISDWSKNDRLISITITETEFTMRRNSLRSVSICLSHDQFEFSLYLVLSVYSVLPSILVLDFWYFPKSKFYDKKYCWFFLKRVTIKGLNGKTHGELLHNLGAVVACKYMPLRKLPNLKSFHECVCVKINPENWNVSAHTCLNPK